MRSILFKDFEERSQEVSKFLMLLKNLEQGSIKLNMGNSRNKKNKIIDPDLDKTLRSTGYLLLYNLVESAMRNAIEVICNEIKSNDIAFDELRDELKQNIIKNFKKNHSHKNSVEDIENISVYIAFIGLSSEKAFSGNITAEVIKQAAIAYGFSCETNARKTKNGADIKQIKNRRNDLAHGIESFKEVGKYATADDLLRIKKSVICYLREILENIEYYISNKEYLK